MSIFNNHLTLDQISYVKDLSSKSKIGDLAKYIGSMLPIERAELALLVWKGRGDEITDEQYQLDYALDQTADAMFADYLSKKPLHTYLEKLGY